MEQLETKRNIRSYVRREGRMTKAQSRAVNAQANPYLIELTSPTDPSQLFRQTGPIVLEIGFGMGEALLAMVQQQPQENFIGVEVHRPGVGSFLLNRAKLELENVRVICADVHHVLTALRPASLDRLQIFFPDPWHKKRHHKRRLIQAEFLSLCAKGLKPHGIIHIATDWQPYAEVIEAVLESHHAFERVDDDYHQQVIAKRAPTKYEQRGLRRGHRISEFVYQV